jgi:hypothetical protein
LGQHQALLKILETSMITAVLLVDTKVALLRLGQRKRVGIDKLAPGLIIEVTIRYNCSYNLRLVL